MAIILAILETLTCHKKWAIFVTMRWKFRKRRKIGELRVVTRFAFWPMKVEDRWIWLETYTATQQLMATQAPLAVAGSIVAWIDSSKWFTIKKDLK